MSIFNPVIAKLKRIADFTPEYEDEDVASIVKEPYEELLLRYPRLICYKNYLDFLKLTGGAHISNQQFSLGIYGFGGYLVPSFDEGEFLDENRYFQFGEIKFFNFPELVLAFDLDSKEETVFISEFEEPNYKTLDCDFIDLLNSFSDGRLPGFEQLETK